MSSLTLHIILHTPDMQLDSAVELHMQSLLPLWPWVLVLQLVEHTEPVAVLPGTALELRLVQAVTVAWRVLAVVPTVLLLVVLPHCCTPVRMAGEQELVAGKNEMKVRR